MDSLVKPGIKLAKIQCVISLIFTFTTTLLVFYNFGYSYATSAFIGGVVCIVPNVIFAYKAFKYAGAQSSKKVVESFFGGVKLKMGLTALLTALSFKFLVIIPVPFFISYFLVMLLTLLTPVLFKL